MSQLTKVALLLGVFLLGCVAEHVLVPPAHAGASPTRWEYSCADTTTGTIAQTANTFGAEGWELVTVSLAGPEAIPCFKRPLP
jgi:hypothetical protein